MLMDVGGRSIFFWEREREGEGCKMKKKKVVGSQVVGSMTQIVGHVPFVIA